MAARQLANAAGGMPRASPSHDPPPPPGLYVVLQPAGATPSANAVRDITFVHEEGEELEIFEACRVSDSRWRGLGPQGWVSFISERGEKLLRPARASASVARSRSQNVSLPSRRKWANFYERCGMSGSATVDVATAMRAVREFLPQAGQRPALLAALCAVEVGIDGTVTRRELESLFAHFLYLDQRWATLQELRREHGDHLSLQAFVMCCRHLGERVSRIEARHAILHLCGLGEGHGEGVLVPFDRFCTWLARFAAGMPPLSSSGRSLGPQRSSSPSHRRSRSRSQLRSRSRSRSPYPRRVRSPLAFDPSLDSSLAAEEPFEEQALRRDMLRRLRKCTGDELAEAWQGIFNGGDRNEEDSRGMVGEGRRLRVSRNWSHRLRRFSDSDSESESESGFSSSDVGGERSNVSPGRMSPRRRRHLRRHGIGGAAAANSDDDISLHSGDGLWDNSGGSVGSEDGDSDSSYRRHYDLSRHSNSSHRHHHRAQVTRWRPTIGDGSSSSTGSRRRSQGKQGSLDVAAERRAVLRCVGMVICHGASFESKLRAQAERTHQPELAFLLKTSNGQHNSSGGARLYKRELARARREPPPSRIRSFLASMALRSENIAYEALRGEGVHMMDDWEQLDGSSHVDRLLAAMRARGSPDEDMRVIRGHLLGSLDGFVPMDWPVHQTHSSELAPVGGGSSSSHRPIQDLSYASSVSPSYMSSQQVALSESATLPPCDGVLYITVLDCSNLLPADKNNSSDPRVEVSFGHGSKKQVQKTKVKKESLNPQYNEEFEFKVVGVSNLRDCDLTLSVYDQDGIVRDKGLTQDFIGSVVVNMGNEFGSAWNSKTVNQMIALGDPDHKVKNATARAALARRVNSPYPYGTIRCEASFVGVEQAGGVLATSMNVSGTWNVRGRNTRRGIGVHRWIVLNQRHNESWVTGGPAEDAEVLERRDGTQKPFTIQNGFIEGSRISFDQYTQANGTEQVTHWHAKLDLRAGLLHMTEGVWSGAVVGTFEATKTALKEQRAASREEPHAQLSRGVSAHARMRDDSPRTRSVSFGGTADTHSVFSDSDIPAHRPPQDGTLRLTIIGCEDLVPADRKRGLQGSFVSSDPFVKVIMNETTWQTKVVEKQLSPRFNEFKDFPIFAREASHSLELQVYDKDTVGADVSAPHRLPYIVHTRWWHSI